MKRKADNTLPVAPLYVERKYVDTYIKYIGTNFLSRDKSKTGQCRFVRLYTIEKIKNKCLTFESNILSQTTDQ